ncbi:MAG: hypothetical protein DI538_19535 [Azospira oryzae]|nr:MAG: hypothetical protein DI538_19535 [Azospira oryzae]
MRKSFLILMGMVTSVLLFATEEINGRIVSVIDGNTIEVVTAEKETYKIILHGVDSPELEQEYGDKARKYLEKKLLDKSVLVKIQGKDRWGTRLGVVVMDGAEDPRFGLLEEGLAWTSEKNPVAELETIKEKAREKGKGLWKAESPTPPWVFRRQQTMMQPKSS